MNILILSWNFPPIVGGIEVVVENLFTGLRARGHEVRVLTAHAAARDDLPGVHRAPRPGLPAFLRAALVRGFRLCRATRPDVLLCGSLTAAPAAWLLGRWFRVPSLVLVYGTEIVRGGAVYRRAVRGLLRRSTRLAAISENTERLLTAAGIPAGRVEVIPPGVAVERFTPQAMDPDRAELPAAWDRRKVILTVGRLVRRKGVHEFVAQAMPEIARRVPEALLLVVGDDARHSLAHRESMRGAIEREVAARGLEEHVRLLGGIARERLLGLYGRADLFVLPCLDLPDDVEGFGIVFLEAALGATPAVATRVGGIPEAVDDGRTGVLVAPGDPAAMAQAVVALLSDDARRRELGRRAARRARERFAWPLINARYEGALERARVAPGGR